MQNWYIRQDTLCTLETYQKNKGKTGAGDTSKDSKMFSWLYLKCFLACCLILTKFVRLEFYLKKVDKTCVNWVRVKKAASTSKISRIEAC